MGREVMRVATRLKLVFTGVGDKKIAMQFPYVRGSATGAEVKALMQGIVADGGVYVDVPTGIVGAELLDSTSTPVDLG